MGRSETNWGGDGGARTCVESNSSFEPVGEAERGEEVSDCATEGEDDTEVGEGDESNLDESDDSDTRTGSEARSDVDVDTMDDDMLGHEGSGV
ncbi:hypothetical protein JDV02_000021 [Purpureocillium takamizusanense]|uniref:Uncharacterized protein n=1 Tax=Purpureocillium takamizusanense TaxID=2060973 RepID=A0A9Q8V5W7_9HYPO|nr:uncharacterized protein JDV02_000021 [Purpureocillium takamizusanense]UNI13264.1 hypothetical protein JDV02_000021 [Purpureocillium takamizusanense]